LAKKVAQQLHAAFGLGKAGTGDNGVGVAVLTPPSPQQQNGYDCGAFVVAIVRHFCTQLISGREGGGPLLLRDVTQPAVAELRSEFKKIVEKMLATP
jgi:Ulp1 family protease